MPVERRADLAVANAGILRDGRAVADIVGGDPSGEGRGPGVFAEVAWRLPVTGVTASLPEYAPAATPAS